MIYLLLFTLCVFAFFTVTGIAISGPTYNGPVTDHFDGRRFINPGNAKAKGFAEVFKWMISRKRGEWHVLDATPGVKPLPSVENRLRITFVNHTTFLIQVDGLNILTDPVWSERVSPFSFAGPKRMRVPGIAFSDLPKIDFVILSHNHYDHFDVPTVKEINALHRPWFIVPLGMARHLQKLGIVSVTELDWWSESQMRAPVTVNALPAQHFSGRGTLDRDRTLWCGYSINTSKGRIYFAGDTGYNANTFKEIGQRFGPFKLSIIPIGAYKPEWFMSPIHCSPDEAVIIHKEVRSEKSIACHFGTFPLADDSLTDPVDDLQKALSKDIVKPQSFITLKEGVPFDLE